MRFGPINFWFSDLNGVIELENMSGFWGSQVLLMWRRLALMFPFYCIQLRFMMIDQKIKWVDILLTFPWVLLLIMLQILYLTTTMLIITTRPLFNSREKKLNEGRLRPLFNNNPSMTWCSWLSKMQAQTVKTANKLLKWATKQFLCLQGAIHS